MKRNRIPIKIKKIKCFSPSVNRLPIRNITEKEKTEYKKNMNQKSINTLLLYKFIKLLPTMQDKQINMNRATVPAIFILPEPLPKRVNIINAETTSEEIKMYFQNIKKNNFNLNVNYFEDNFSASKLLDDLI